MSDESDELAKRRFKLLPKTWSMKRGHQSPSQTSAISLRSILIYPLGYPILDMICHHFKASSRHWLHLTIPGRPGTSKVNALSPESIRFLGLLNADRQMWLVNATSPNSNCFHLFSLRFMGKKTSRCTSTLDTSCPMCPKWVPAAIWMTSPDLSTAQSPPSRRSFWTTTLVSSLEDGESVQIFQVAGPIQPYSGQIRRNICHETRWLDVKPIRFWTPPTQVHSVADLRHGAAKQPNVLKNLSYGLAGKIVGIINKTRR